MATLKGSMSTEGQRLQDLSYLTGARYVQPAVPVLVIAQPISEVLEGPMNYPLRYRCIHKRQNFGVNLYIIFIFVALDIASSYAMGCRQFAPSRGLVMMSWS